MKVELTEDQKQMALDLFDKNPDLNFLAKKISGDDSIDGRSKFGRALRDFLALQGKEYKAKGDYTKKQIGLTEPQKQFLMSGKISSEMKPLEIARLCFKDESIKSLSVQHRAVLDYLTTYRPDIIDESMMLADGKWYEPKSIEAVVRKVNKWNDLNLPQDISQLNVKHRKSIEKLFSYLKIYKLISTINSLKTQSDRELFESEFVRATWDKPDLTVDEVNLYQMICSNHVRASHIQKRLDSFNTMLENEDLSSDEISVKLTDHCKAVNDELNSCEKRIESLTQKLNGDRAKRIEANKTNNSSILALVEAFQEEEDRRQMVVKAQLRSELVKKEADKLEDMDEFRARIFGIGIDELI